MRPKQEQDEHHEPRVVCNFNRNMAMEVARGNQQVALIRLYNGTVGLEKMSAREFDHEFYLEPPIGMNGIAPTPRHFSRQMLAAKHFTISEVAAGIMVDIMALDVAEPRSEHTAILVSNDGHFAGAYTCVGDAQLVKHFVPGHVIHTPEHLASLNEGAIKTLAQDVAPKLKATRSRSKHMEAVLMAAKKTAKPKAPKVKAVSKVEKQRVAKTDGPVFKVKQYVEANASKFRGGSLTKVQAVDELKALGIHKGTIGVQLSKQLKALGIDAQKGSRAKPKTTKEPKAKPAAKKTAAKKTSSTKKGGGNGKAEVPSTPKAKAEAAKKAATTAAPVAAA